MFNNTGGNNLFGNASGNTGNIFSKPQQQGTGTSNLFGQNQQNQGGGSSIFGNKGIFLII